MLQLAKLRATQRSNIDFMQHASATDPRKASASVLCASVAARYAQVLAQSSVFSSIRVGHLDDRGQNKCFFGKRCLLRKVHFLETLENLEILESPKTVEEQGESDHVLQILMRDFRDSMRGPLS